MSIVETVLKEIQAETRLKGSILEVPEHRQFTSAEIQETPIDILHNYGFRNWDDNLLLFPSWAINLLKDGERMDCIDGSFVIKGKDYIDDDHRGGCIAFGVIHTGLKKN